jgi:DNA-binding NtrC family response regulator
MSAKILILEDEDRMRRLLELVLQEPGYQVKSAPDGLAGIAQWKAWQPDLVLSDLNMPKMDGLEVLHFRNTHFPAIPFILLTAFGTVETAVAAMKEGAFDYLTKPVDNELVLELVAKALASTKRNDEADARMIGSSAALQSIRDSIAMLAETDSSVLITGESGTGKDLVALAIHDAYAGPDSPYVQVNCPAIPGDLLESELFGHRRGSFTGAVANRTGAFVNAHGGTLFLDEIGNLPLDLQPKLLHAVEQRKIVAVGDSTPQDVQLKIISATNCDMEAMVAQGTFRQDLYYRLNTLQIQLPPLRQRSEDIEELVNYFLVQFSRQYKKKLMQVEAAVLDQMLLYQWPGNIRELRNVVESACLRCTGDVLTVDLLPETLFNKEVLGNTPTAGHSGSDLVATERHFIVQALEQCYWNQSQAAKRLGITRNTLRYRIKKHGIERMAP